MGGCFSIAHAEPLGCLIEPDLVAEVGTPMLGVIDQLPIERGDAVRAGQVLAQLSSGVERAYMAVAESRARAEAEVKSAEASASLAQRKLVRARYLVQQKFMSEQALEQAQAESSVAELAATQAREARDVAVRELELSTAQLNQRTIRSPFDGVVIERYRSVGERVDREAIAKVAKVDPLRVEVIVPAAQFGTVSAGQQFQVRPQLAQFEPQLATVTVVDRVIDPASNSFRVRLSMPNPAQAVPAGLRCQVDFNASATAPKNAGASRSSLNPAPPVVPAAYKHKPLPQPTKPARTSRLGPGPLVSEPQFALRHHGAPLRSS